jgi:hypothetical protein
VRNPLGKLAKSLSAHEPVEMLSSVGALQLVPQNADRTARLEALAYAAVAVRPRPAALPLSRNALHRLCNEGLIAAEPASLEDPQSSPFTESFTFYGGSYVVFPGAGDSSPYILRQLAAGVFLHPEPLSPEVFVTAAKALLLGTLVLSNGRHGEPA